MKRLLLFLFLTIPILVFGQGSMDFEGETGLTASYTDASFTEDGIEYTYNRSRNEGEYGIANKGLIFQNNTSYFEWEISNGIGELSFQYRKAFTGGTNRKIEIYINDELYESTDIFGSGSGEQTNVYSFSTVIDEENPISIRIKNSGAQVTIDNIVWTAYGESGTPCEAPTNLEVSDITQTAATISWEGDADEYVVSYGSETITVSNTNIELEDLTSGTSYEVEIMSVCDGTEGESVIVYFETAEESTPPIDGDFCFGDDFADITTGDNTTSTGSSATWSGNENFPTVDRAYQAGGTVKLGTGSAVGFIQSKNLNGVSGDIEVIIMVKGWTNIEGNLEVSIDGQVEIAQYSATMGDAFEEVSVSFEDVTAGANLKIATTAKRAFIGDVKILCDDEGSTDPEPEICEAPANIVITNITETSASISWEGDADEYQVTYSDGDNENSATTTENNLDLENLSDGTAYTVTITSICDEEEGESASANFETETAPTPCVDGVERHETFDNLSYSGTAYQNGEFIGNDGITWTYLQSRGDSEIDGKAIMLGRNRTPDAELTSSTICNGIGTLQFSYMQAFGNNVDMQVYVNDQLVYTATTDGQQEEIITTDQIEVEIEGEFTFRFYNPNGGQVTIDDIIWTAYGETSAPCLAPTDITVTNVTEDSVTVTWNAGGDETIWDPAYGYAGWDIINEEPIYYESVSNTEVTFYNLEPNTEYDFYIYSFCEDGISDIAGPVSFTTLEEEIEECEIPTDVEVSDITETTATVSWIVPQSYALITYGEAPFSPSEDAADWENIYGGSTDLENLEPGTTYDFYIRSMCNESFDDLSEWTTISFTTEGTGVEDCEAPTDLAVDFWEPTFALVSWEGNADNYEIAWGASPYEPGDDHGQQFTTGDVNSYYIGTEGGTVYDVYVRALCEDSESEWTSTSFETDEAECQSPMGISIDNITEDGATITWSAANEGDDQWEISLTTGGQSADQGMIATVTGTPEYTATGLDADTTYSVHLRTICSDDESSEWAYNGEFTTLEATEEFDCEDLEANIGEVCYDEEGNQGVVTEDCDCYVEIVDDCEVPSSDDNDIFISKIHIDGIGVDINNDYYDLNYTSSAKSADGYAFVDSPEFTIYPNYNGSYSVSSGPAGNGGAYYYAVWIDFNGDGCFDEGEQVIWSDGAITNDLFDDENVPSSFSALAPGTYTARIRNSMQGWPSAHGVSDGEALDFILHIVSEDEAEHMLGIDSQVFNNFSFYPNPVQHQLNLAAGNSIEQVEIYNLLGQKVISVQPNALQTIIDTDQLQTGTYMMNVMIDGSKKSYKIIKK